MVFQTGPSRRGALLILVALIAAAATPIAAGDDPIFVRWLVPDDPGDETIREYWERSVNNELDGPGLVDLGTMLFYRGWSKDAVKMYKKALKIDSGLYEAWFRIGLVEHSSGNLSDAGQAYRRCLKLMVGHGWCNFYLGLLEEQLGHSSNALSYYEKAFALAPELADPKVNPEVLSSRLVLGARLRTYDHERFVNSLPIEYMEPERVHRTKAAYEPEPPPAPEAPPAPEGAVVEDTMSSGEIQDQPRTVMPTPAPQPPPRSVPSRRPTSGSPTPYGTVEPPPEHPQREIAPQTAPQVGSVSNEASLAPGLVLPVWMVDALT